MRKTRALALTADGERLLRSARSALGGIDRTVDEIRGQTRSQRVVVTTYASFASLWLVPRLAAFQRSFPGIELHINADGRRLNLEAEGIDLALRRCPPADAPAGAQYSSMGTTSLAPKRPGWSLSAPVAAMYSVREARPTSPLRNGPSALKPLAKSRGVSDSTAIR